ncbi:transcriptional regulator [Gottschalkia purinilytica]|uniref:Transcriptional regulator n=1 Tax=Gottschalkia purinilytica TaxID=1503 RepID=A0A0L0WAN7_GOTPU|nr:GntR family transcriptional regulator [Gottschalkia purinilytica]KNF08512.1 transcriptional regulator [Gottschalkia purinilytica]
MGKKRLRNKALSEEVKLYIIKYIKTLDLKKNNKLPSEELLSELIGVSRITVRSALNELASEGIIFRRQGKGTFVNTEALKIKVTFNPVLQFKDMITNSGYSPSVKLLGLETKKASKNMASLLRIEEGQDIVVAKKMFYADKKPCAFCIDYFDKSIIPDQADYDDLIKYENSIFEFINSKTNRCVTWDKVEILTETNLQNPELKKNFNCDNNTIKSFLLLKGLNFDNEDKPLIYAKEYIDTDFIRFNMIRQRNINYY